MLFEKLSKNEKAFIELLCKQWQYPLYVGIMRTGLPYDISYESTFFHDRYRCVIDKKDGKIVAIMNREIPTEDAYDHYRMAIYDDSKSVLEFEHNEYLLCKHGGGIIEYLSCKFEYTTEFDSKITEKRLVGGRAVVVDNKEELDKIFEEYID